MRVLIVGANGNIGRHVIQLMAASPHQSQAMIRRADQSRDLLDMGANETVVADLEEEIQHALDGCDAVIFTAGSGGHTGPEKTDAIDRDGAIAVIDAACKAGIRRFVMVSSIGADDPDNGPEELQHYLRAKQAADAHLRHSGLHFTIVRPGSLTDDAATGLVEATVETRHSGSIPRADVAAVLLQVLDASNTEGKTFVLLTGQTPLAAAIAAL